MIPGPSRYFSCPTCKTEHSFPGYISRTVFGGTLFSDLSRNDYSMGEDLPRYAVCRNCGLIRPCGDFKEVFHNENKSLPMLEEAEVSQLMKSLVTEPYQSDFTYGHNLYLHLFREDNHRLAAGIPASDPTWRPTLLDVVYSHCERFSLNPIYALIAIEIERYWGLFETATQRSTTLIQTCEDPIVRHYAEQQYQFCKEQRRTRQRLKWLSMPKANADPPFTTRRGLKYLLVATKNPHIGTSVKAWVSFPEMLTEVLQLRDLQVMASVMDPLLGGIVLVSREVQVAYPAVDQLGAFLTSDFGLVKDIPILLVMDATVSGDYNQALKCALRDNAFHVSAIREPFFDAERFARWRLTHQRRAEKRVRSVLKFLPAAPSNSN